MAQIVSEDDFCGEKLVAASQAGNPAPTSALAT